MAISVEIASVSDCTLIRLSGDADDGTAERISVAVRDVCVADAHAALIIDLTEVSLVDSVLASALTKQLPDSLHERVVLVSPRLTARKILHRQSADVALFSSVDDAVRARHAP